MVIKKKEQLRGLWQFSPFLAQIEEKFQLSLGEGQTPEENFAEVVLKREDKNPTGSLKDRGMAYLVSYAYSIGEKKLVISSSGNAAISAASYAGLAGLDLTVFLSPKINLEKLAKIKETGVKIVFSNKTVSEATLFAKKNGLYNLRPSIHEFGPEGYQTIAFELMRSREKVEDIFIPVSSGVALTGIARGFEKVGFLPKLHLCQGAGFCPLGSLFDKDFVTEKENLPQALVAKTTVLKTPIIEWIKKSRGNGWVVQNKEIETAQNKLKEKGIETSEEGALAFAAVEKARRKGFVLGKTVVLLTGKKY
ncbi:MAG: pyridoxal-phosphate dependent enzyme [Patescibacteria group bacterium]|nr:pyridoxal-phosphate dependent enzyme [Patescibacteria group bacterium]